MCHIPHRQYYVRMVLPQSWFRGPNTSSGYKEAQWNLNSEVPVEISYRQLSYTENECWSLKANYRKWKQKNVLWCTPEKSISTEIIYYISNQKPVLLLRIMKTWKKPLTKERKAKVAARKDQWLSSLQQCADKTRQHQTYTSIKLLH